MVFVQHRILIKYGYISTCSFPTYTKWIWECRFAHWIGKKNITHIVSSNGDWIYFITPFVQCFEKEEKQEHLFLKYSCYFAAFLAWFTYIISLMRNRACTKAIPLLNVGTNIYFHWNAFHARMPSDSICTVHFHSFLLFHVCHIEKYYLQAENG